MRSEAKGLSVRFTVSAAFLAALWSLAFAAPATAACPNENFRTGPSANLPECRAYEMVSPVDKNGGYVQLGGPVRVTPGGDAVEFNSYSAFAGNAGSPWYPFYASRRRATNWDTQGLDPVLYNPSGNLIGRTAAASSTDLTKTLQVSKVALLPGAVEGGSNVYVQNDLTGERELVAAREGDALFNLASNEPGIYVDGSSDWSHVLLTSKYAFNGEVTDGTQHLYDFAEGRPRVIDVLPNGEIAAAAHLPSRGIPYAHAMSEDGSRAFFMVGSFGAGALYMRENNSRTVPISASQNPATLGTVYPAEFVAATPDGSRVYFTSTAQLTEEAAGGLYRYDVESEKLTVLVGSDVETLALSEDGSYIYFASTAALAGATTPPVSSANLYALHDGQTKWVGQTVPGGAEASGPIEALSSPDGAHFAFASFSPLTEDALPSAACPRRAGSANSPGLCMEVYSYEFASGELTCVSCADPNRGHSDLGGQVSGIHLPGTGDRFPRAVLDDGTVFFDTPSKLLARDVNGTIDAYSWKDGEYGLISTGTDARESSFGDATTDGSDIFFRTFQPLVKQDVDGSADLYDARVDGGLAGQWPPGSSPPCEGEECRSATSAAGRGTAFIGTAEVGEDGNQLPRCTRLALRAAGASRRAHREAMRARRADRLVRRDLKRRAQRQGGRAAVRLRRARRRARQQHRRAAVQLRKARRINAKARNCGGQG